MHNEIKKLSNELKKMIKNLSYDELQQHNDSLPKEIRTQLQEIVKLENS